MMTHEFLAAQSRTYRRAALLQKRLVELAGAAQAIGSHREADKLLQVGERVWIIADRYIETLFAKVN